MGNAKSKRVRQIVLIVTAIVAVVVFAFIGFIMMIGNAVSNIVEFMPPANGTGCLGERPFSIERIEQMANLQVPESTSDLSAYSIAFMDCTIYVRFEIDAEELGMFVQSTYVTDSLQSAMAAPVTARQFDDVLDVVMWDISPTDNFIFGHGSDGSREFQSIAVDVSDSQRYVVYVITDLL